MSAVTSAADPVGVVHVAVVANGQIQHRIRNTDGTWSPWGGLGNPGSAVSIGGAVDPTGTCHLTVSS